MNKNPSHQIKINSKEFYILHLVKIEILENQILKLTLSSQNKTAKRKIAPQEWLSSKSF